LAQEVHLFESDAGAEASEGMHVLVMDENLAGREILEENLASNTIIVGCDPANTSLDQLYSSIEATLNSIPIETLAFVTHGEAGEFTLLSDVVVSLETLQRNTYLVEFWANIGSLIEPDGRIDILGCDVASTEEGLELRGGRWRPSRS
jgi:hypothetical protein